MWDMRIPHWIVFIWFQGTMQGIVPVVRPRNVAHSLKLYVSYRSKPYIRFPHHNSKTIPWWWSSTSLSRQVVFSWGGGCTYTIYLWRYLGTRGNLRAVFSTFQAILPTIRRIQRSTHSITRLKRIYPAIKCGKLYDRLYIGSWAIESEEIGVGVGVQQVEEI